MTMQWHIYTTSVFDFVRFSAFGHIFKGPKWEGDSPRFIWKRKLEQFLKHYVELLYFKKMTMDKYQTWAVLALFQFPDIYEYLSWKCQTRNDW